MRRPLPFLALGALLLVASAANAQPGREPAPPQPTVTIPGGGTELFRALLDRAGVKPVTAQEARRFVPDDDTVVIVVGNTNSYTNLPNSPLELARRSVGAGGGVLVATDSQTSYTNWAQTRLAQVGGARVENDDVRAIHDQREFCPYLVPVRPGDEVAAPPKMSAAARLLDGLTSVATNEPSYLLVGEPAGEFQSALARLPMGSGVVGVDGFGGRVIRAFQSPPLFAVAGEGPDNENPIRYQFLMLADHSVFINQMLIEPGTQNLEFTYRVIDYLRGPQKRGRCLFIENGRVVEDFSGLRKAFAPPPPPMPMPDLGAMQEKLVDLANVMIAEAQNRNVLNNMVTRGIGIPAVVRALLILLTLYATWFLMKRMFSSRKPTDVPPPPNVAGVPTGPPGVFDRRQRELLRRNNLYEPVRDLVRDFFLSVGVPASAGPKLPGVLIARSVRRPESLRQALKDFWKLAFGPPQEVSVRQWQEWEPYYERLRQAHADGKWRFSDAMA